MTDKTELKKVDQRVGPSPKLQDKAYSLTRVVSGLKPELYWKRVMGRSATMSREVKLPLSFRTLDTREVFSITGLLDSGATDSFINKEVIDRHKLKVETLD
jgi:hypothetical protein